MRGQFSVDAVVATFFWISSLMIVLSLVNDRLYYQKELYSEVSSRMDTSVFAQSLYTKPTGNPLLSGFVPIITNTGVNLTALHIFFGQSKENIAYHTNASSFGVYVEILPSINVEIISPESFNRTAHFFITTSKEASLYITISGTYFDGSVEKGISKVFVSKSPYVLKVDLPKGTYSIKVLAVKDDMTFGYAEKLFRVI